MADIQSHNQVAPTSPLSKQFLSNDVATSDRAPPHLDYLDGWRGCAILFLLVGHFFRYLVLILVTSVLNCFLFYLGY